MSKLDIVYTVIGVGLTMVCAVVLTSVFNVVTNAAEKAIVASGRKLKSLTEIRKEKKAAEKSA